MQQALFEEVDYGYDSKVGQNALTRAYLKDCFGVFALNEHVCQSFVVHGVLEVDDHPHQRLYVKLFISVFIDTILV